MESSWTRDWTHVPCIGRCILIHFTTREVLSHYFFSHSLLLWFHSIHCSSLWCTLFPLLSIFLSFSFCSSNWILSTDLSSNLFFYFFLFLGQVCCWISLLNSSVYSLSYVHAKLSPSRVTLCDPMDCNPPQSSVHGIHQAIILEWVAMCSSRGSSRPRDRTRVSYISCTGRWVLYHYHHLGSPLVYYSVSKYLVSSLFLNFICLYCSYFICIIFLVSKNIWILL